MHTSLMSLPEVERERIISERWEKKKKQEEKDALRRSVGGVGERQLRERTRPSDDRAAAALSDLRKKRTGGAGATAAAKEPAPLSSHRHHHHHRHRHRDEEKDEEYKQEEEDEYGEEETQQQPQTMTPSPLASEEEEEEEDKGKSPAKAAVAAGDEKCVIGFEDVEKVTLKREQLLRLIEEPFFEDAVRGFFVRVVLGSNAGNVVYRMAQIAGSRQASRVLVLANKRKTNTVLLLRYPGVHQNKDMRVDYISNSAITQTEFEKFLHDAETAGEQVRVPQEVPVMLIRLREALSHAHTDEEVARMVQQKEARRAKPVNIAASKVLLQTKLKVLIDHSMDAEGEEIQRVKQRLEELTHIEEQEAEAVAMTAVAMKKVPVAVAAINEKRRQQNYELQRAAAQLAQAECKDSKSHVFERIKTAPTVMAPPDKKKADAKAAEDPKKAAAPAGEKPKQAEVKAKAPEKPKPVVEDTDTKLRKAHDFELAIDDFVMQPPSASASATVAAAAAITTPVQAPAAAPPPISLIPIQPPPTAAGVGQTKKLSLSEYLKQRKGK